MDTQMKKEIRDAWATAPDDLYVPYKAWREATLADGWSEIPGGPWGTQDRSRGNDPRTGQLHHTGERSPGDRSIKLLLDEFIVQLVDRDRAYLFTRTIYARMGREW